MDNTSRLSNSNAYFQAHYQLQTSGTAVQEQQYIMLVPDQRRTALLPERRRSELHLYRNLLPPHTV